MNLLCSARRFSMLLLASQLLCCESFILQRQQTAFVNYPQISFQSRSRATTSRLRAFDNNQTSAMEEVPTASEDQSLVPDAGLLVADLFGLAVAFQLLGLLDAINAPDFVTKGGWFQPPPSVSESTLDVLVQRYSLNSIVWIMAAIISRGYQDDAVSSVDKAIRTALKVVLIYGLGRIGLAVAIAAYQGSLIEAEAWEALRECYFVALAMSTTRYLIYKLYYR